MSSPGGPDRLGLGGHHGERREVVAGQVGQLLSTDLVDHGVHAGVGLVAGERVAQRVAGGAQLRLEGGATSARDVFSLARVLRSRARSSAAPTSPAGGALVRRLGVAAGQPAHDATDVADRARWGSRTRPYRPEDMIRLIASARVAAWWMVPRTAEVTVLAPGSRTPRIVMQRCSASITTRAAGLRISISASAIWVVSRSCTCGRRAKTSTSRASLDSPVMWPAGGSRCARSR